MGTIRIVAGNQVVYFAVQYEGNNSPKVAYIFNANWGTGGISNCTD